MLRLREVWQRHPSLISWLLLGLAMVAVVAVAARDVGFNFPQWVALIIATVVLAGLCVWIVGWEDDDTD